MVVGVLCLLNTLTWQNLVAPKHLWPMKCWSIPSPAHWKACPPRVPCVSVVLDSPRSRGISHVSGSASAMLDSSSPHRLWPGQQQSLSPSYGISRPLKMSFVEQPLKSGPKASRTIILQMDWEQNLRLKISSHKSRFWGPSKSALLQLACVWWWGAHLLWGNLPIFAQLQVFKSVSPLLFNWEVTYEQ